ncbi:hypothetical protein HU200_067008 [Digitaria exilis]|uniref:NAB domain-containing protein n=1 Tax=Digitaria exilis TaxID=1010633 RepID=A0A835A5Q4_9POAL|nr:hypothetical protein HU200_067008 [Digitaria exilis]
MHAPSADMENRVKIMLKLLGQEADSFGKRAEMYYRTRPEVISHVEQLYRAYRALVERYDHISKELHKANHTIATACPEEVQYAMLEEEDGDFPKAITPINSHKIHRSTVQEILNRKRQAPSGRNMPASAPHMTTEEAEQEISRLQKAILVLQTEKEYVKSAYESGIARYWEIEKQIADTQEEICLIQDKFDAHAAIHDDEARALMTIAALRSCQEEIADSVDELVDKVVNLELKLPKQSAQINQLKQENDNLKNKLDELQDEMALCDDQSSLNAQLKLLEDELNRVRILERSIIEEEVSVSIGFSEVFSCIMNISKALGSLEHEDLYNFSNDVGDSATPSTDMSVEYFTEGSKVGEFRDIEAPALNDCLGQDREDFPEVFSDKGNDGIHGSKNGDEERFSTDNCLMQLVRNKTYCSSGNENASGNFIQGQILNGEYPSTEASESLMEIAEGNIGHGNAFTGSSVGMNDRINADAYSSDATSLCVRAGDSEGTEGSCGQALGVLTDLENMASDVRYSQLEKKSSNAKNLQEHLEETKAVIRELKNANSMKSSTEDTRRCRKKWRTQKIIREDPDPAAEPEPAEKKLRELGTELDVWFEQNALLDQEVQA